MGQICGGAAFLERRGLVHGDLRPDNVVLDQNGNARLIDFGCSTMPVGEHYFGIGEPFGRELRPDELAKAPDLYGFGNAGPRTEIFALGSIYYSLLRGHYPYEHEQYSHETLARLFRLEQYPTLGEFPQPDRIIAWCWEGDRHYKTVAELEQVFRDMKDGTEWYRFEAEDASWCAEQKTKCEEWIHAGQLSLLLENRRL